MHPGPFSPFKGLTSVEDSGVACGPEVVVTE